MAATETLPSTKPEVPLTTDSLFVQPFEPITKIAELVSTQSVDIDISNLAIQVAPPSDMIELEVEARNKKLIEDALGKLVGGDAFAFWLYEQDGLKGRYTLKVQNLIGTIDPVKFPRLLQSKENRIVVFAQGTLIDIDPEDVLADLFPHAF